MRVTRAGDVLGGGAELHGDHRFGNHVAGIGADQMHAKNAVGFRVREDLHKSVGGQIDLGAAVGGEGKLADIVGDAGGLQFLFAFADRGNFRIGVDDVGNGVVVHVPRLPDQNFG